MIRTTPELAHPFTTVSHHTGGRRCAPPTYVLKCNRSNTQRIFCGIEFQNLEPSVSEASTFPLCHHCQPMIDNAVDDTFLINLRYDTYE
ncbi:hypothetical protein AVEN_136761-1 [Araneus ventricosus]|uniref:Uncharacterized protein n=1 Tax=Araneus ventricosus TaxID=182803 RepID=A0A4Y2B706_ARAVE|nr:hypothetical protein AVEN_136761-1 [Araneus ventricosus]